MTPATLRSYKCKDLAQMARDKGLAGWHSMRKEELIAALAGSAKSSENRTKRRTGTKASTQNHKGTSAQKPSAARLKIQKQIVQLQQQQSKLKNLGTSSDSAAVERDQLVVLVRDPYWLHACWELSQQSVDRAQSAMGQHWHSARPILKLYRIESDDSSTLEADVEVHGGVSNWYLSVNDPPKSYRAEIGYQSPGAEFYCLARSNTVTTPAAGSAETIDGNWADVAENADRIFAMSGGYSADGASMELQELLEQRLRRRLGRPAQTRYGTGAADDRREDFHLAIDAELVIYGSTDPHTHVTIKGEPVPVNPDGSFAVKMHLPDRRQVVPVVAGSSDGVEQKTVILGVERNTKVLDPVVRQTASST